MPVLAVGGLSSVALADDLGCGASPDVPFFNDLVPQPPVAKPDNNSANHYTLTASLGKHQFSSAKGWLPADSLSYNSTGYAGRVTYLGPTIITQQGKPIRVTVKNALPTRNVLPMFPWDKTEDTNKIVVHRHGGLQAVADDGIPGQEIVPGGSHENYYPNSQPAAPLWYHDHADGVTSYRVYEGLAGYMPNTDGIEPGLNLPKGAFSKAYVLQDKKFTGAGQLCYSHNEPEFFGDLPVVNGIVAPYEAVQPRKYMFTLLNGADSRFMHLTLKRTDTTTSTTTSGSATPPTMTVVGSDEGYLRNPTNVNDLLISPGERYTVVVNFANHQNQNWVLSNDAAAPYPGNGAPPSGATGGDRTNQLMQFRVAATRTVADTSSIPRTIVTPENGDFRLRLWLAKLRTVQAGEKEVNGEVMPMLGDKTGGLKMPMDLPVTEKPLFRSTEVWALRNWSPDAHPIHPHLASLRLVGRWPATFDKSTGALLSVDATKMELPKAYESGPKDTFVSPNNYITAWVGTFNIAGKSVWHCHILSHEDTSMMRPLEVVTKGQTTGLPVVLTLGRLDGLVRQK